MNKPALSVPGIDPARIECEEDGGWQRVRVDRICVASIDERSVPAFGFVDNLNCTKDRLAVMVAAFDHWRATGRLFPEPPPEPVECVCGGKGKLQIDGEVVFCGDVSCRLAANTVAEWSVMQAALKAAKFHAATATLRGAVSVGRPHS